MAGEVRMVNQSHFHLTVGVFTYLLVRSCRIRYIPSHFPGASKSPTKTTTYLSPAAICCIEISSYWPAEYGILILDGYIGYLYLHMGVSENSVALNPLVNDHYPN